MVRRQQLHPHVAHRPNYEEVRRLGPTEGMYTKCEAAIICPLSLRQKDLVLRASSGQIITLLTLPADSYVFCNTIIERGGWRRIYCV